MKQLSLFIFFIVIIIHSDAQTLWNHGRLKVTPNGHSLQFTDGTAFFWLGDTGWELFHRLNDEQADYYLKIDTIDVRKLEIEAVAGALRGEKNQPVNYLHKH